VTISTKERQHLAAILGMLGSDHAGERAAAGLQAEAFRRKHRLTWEELLGEVAATATAVPPPQEPSWPEYAGSWNRVSRGVAYPDWVKKSCLWVAILIGALAFY
jgi:hypothetical protein